MSGKVIHVLLIEDDRDDCRLVHSWLGSVEEYEYRIDWASTYEEGLVRLVDGRFDVCLLDYQLGARDGLELLAEAGRLGVRTPVIFLTGQRSREVDMRALEMGAADFLVKADITAALLDRAIRYVSARARTEQALHKAKEEAEKATRLKDDFVALVAHDLKSPLASLTGLLGMVLERDYVRPEGELMVRRCLETANRMLSAVTELLSVGRLQRGQVTLKMEALDLKKMVSASIGMIEHLAQGKGVEIVNRVPDGRIVTADVGLLMEVLGNLLSNAVKFCDEGDVITFYAPDDEEASLAVRDTGRGIDPEYLPHLFTHDVKTTGVGTQGERGTGLGLPYCRDIMALHGGSIRAASAPGDGTVVYLTFPSCS